MEDFSKKAESKSLLKNQKHFKEGEEVEALMKIKELKGVLGRKNNGIWNQHNLAQEISINLEEEEEEREILMRIIINSVEVEEEEEIKSQREALVEG